MTHKLRQWLFKEIQIAKRSPKKALSNPWATYLIHKKSQRLTPKEKAVFSIQQMCRYFKKLKLSVSALKGISMIKKILFAWWALFNKKYPSPKISIAIINLFKIKITLNPAHKIQTYWQMKIAKIKSCSSKFLFKTWNIHISMY